MLRAVKLFLLMLGCAAGFWHGLAHRGFADARTASELLKLAAKNAGHEVVRTASISFEALIADAPPADEEVERQISNIERDARKLMEREKDNRALVEMLEKSLANSRSTWVAQINDNAKRQVRGVYLIGGMKAGSDHLIEFRVKRFAEENWGEQMVLLTRDLGGNRRISIVHDAAARSAMITQGKFVAGIDNPHMFGRLQGIGLSIGANLLEPTRSASESDTLDYEVEFAEVDQADGVLRTIDVSTLAPAKRTVTRIVVDVSQGYVCPVIEEYGAQSEVLRKWTCSDFFQEPRSRLFFPRSVVFEAVSDRGGDSVPTKVEYTFPVEGIELNESYSPARFTVDLPSGTGVSTGNRSSEGAWRAIRGLSLSLDQVDALNTVQGLEPVIVTPKLEHVTLQPGDRRWFLWVNGVMLIGIAVLYLFNRTSKRRKLSCIVGGALLWPASGCGWIERPAERVENELVLANPAMVSFGRIAAEGQIVSQSVQFSNSSSHKPIRIELSTGCGCLELADSVLHIPPLSTASVPVRISAAGRVGEFDSTLKAVWHFDGDLLHGGEMEVPIHASFVRTVFAIPSRVLMERGGAEATAMVVIEAPADEWGKITVDCPDADVSVQELALKSVKNQSETRRFRVTAAAGINFDETQICVRTQGQPIPMLTIPVLMTDR